MKSMTGYGRGGCAQNGFKITVELSAVNRRQSEISLNLPRELEMLEAPIRDAINAKIARGRVMARVSVHAGAGKLSARMHINLPLARAYTTELNRLAKQLKLAGEVTLDQLVRAPGVLQTDEELVEAEKIWPVVEQALKPALAALVKMREREGAHLAQDLTARIGIMRKAVGKIQRQAPQTVENYRQQLLGRIRSAGIENLAPDDERLLKEIVLFADRSDISLGRELHQDVLAPPARKPLDRAVDRA